MATFTKRYNCDGELIGWQAKIRRQGFPIQSKTFDRKADAEAWARGIEGEMDRGAFIDRRPAEQMTLGDAIRHYLDAVAPTHKGGDIEKVRLGRVDIHLVQMNALTRQRMDRNALGVWS